MSFQDNAFQNNAFQVDVEQSAGPTIVTPTEGILQIVGEQPNIFATRGTAVIQPGRRLVALDRRRYRRWHVRDGVYRASLSVDSGRSGLVYADMQTTSLVIQGQQVTSVALSSVTNATLTIQGQQPSIAIADFPVTGALTIQGQQPSIAIADFPLTGTLTIQGQQPVITAQTFPVEAVLVINGQQPTVTGTTGGATTVTPTEGILVINGQQPAVASIATTTTTEGILYIVSEAPTLALQGSPSPPLADAEQGGGARTDMARYTKRLRQQKALMMVIEEFLKHAA